MLRTINILIILACAILVACAPEDVSKETSTAVSPQTAPAKPTIPQTYSPTPQKQNQTYITYQPPTVTTPPPKPRTVKPLPSATPQPTTSPTPTPSPFIPPPLPSSAPAPTPVQEPSATAPQPINQITVTRVIDGDTIEVLIEGVKYSVRYIGIDAPEYGDWLYSEATELNKSLVLGKAVRLEKDISDTDMFGRLLRYVYVENIFVNAELVRTGLARAYPYKPDTFNEALFNQIQANASASGHGLWAQPQITFMFFDGIVPKVESDEYVEICNNGGMPFNITGWKLKDENNNVFTFPPFTLESNSKIRVYTNEKHPEWGGFSFSSPSAIWNNNRDTAKLYNGLGQLISILRYNN